MILRLIQHVSQGSPLIRAGSMAIGQTLLRGCFNQVLERMVEDQDTRKKIIRQAIEYEEQRGDAFSLQMAKESISSMSPLDWWRSYGGRAIEIQRFAKRVIHTKRRNRLLHKRLNKIVFVSYNWKMRTRFQLMREQAGKKYDPLVIEEFDWNNEWADSLHVSAPGVRGSDSVNDLTWQHVDDAIGASQSLRGRNLPRRAQNNSQSRNSAAVVAKEQDSDEDQSYSEGEDEEEDPHDDADVSDCEDAADAPNANEEDMADADDEFDDGF